MYLTAARDPLKLRDKVPLKKGSRAKDRGKRGVAFGWRGPHWGARE